MKITNTRLKKVIKEEVEGNEALLKAIEGLANRIENLDVSIDYLAASITGEDPVVLSYGQTALGRYRKPPNRTPPPEVSESETTKIGTGALKKLISEKVIDKLIERQVETFRTALREECKKEGILLTEEKEKDEIDLYRKETRRNFLKQLGKWGAAAGLAGAIGLPLGSAIQKDKEERDTARTQHKEETFNKVNTKEYKEKEFLEYLNNTAAFRWGKGQESMMQIPGSAKTVGGIKRGIGVLPPSYTIALRALLDKRNGAPIYEPPEQQVSLTQGDGGAAQQNLDTFFEDFEEKDFVDYGAAFKISGIKHVPGGGLERGMKMVDPRSIPPSYVLPENGLTAQEYYNWVYYNQFLSLDEVYDARDWGIETAEDDDKYIKMEKLFTDATPGAWKKALGIE
tara:strand:- start:2825 stop:4018 length:1194 start_codon:yes stop_codon:yes gene_type:complete